MNAFSMPVPAPTPILTPSPRRMSVSDPSNPETSLDWVPELRTLFSKTDRFGNELYVPAECPGGGTYQGIYRPGYDANPLGVVTENTYRSLNHMSDTDVVMSSGAKITPAGSLIDGHGYHTVQRFRLDFTDVAKEVKGLPMADLMMLVHDHTGKGSVRASVVTYLGKACVGSSVFVRKIHTGMGDRHVGAGGKAGWGDTVAKLCEDAMLYQDSLLTILKAAADKPVDDAARAIFNAAWRKTGYVIPEEKDLRPMNCLLAVIEYHEVQRGPMCWGVWSRRLEGDAIRALSDITGIKLEKKG